MNLAMGVRVCMRVFVRETFLVAQKLMAARNCGPLQKHFNADDCASSRGAP